MAIMETPYYVFLGYLPPPKKKMKYASMANEACFIRQRSLLHLALKLTSFFYAKNRACGLTIFILNNMGKTSDCV